MKSRPRRVENEVAARLSVHFVAMGMSPVQRIPVLGRTGPDITVNESKLAIDVKSRKTVPVCFAPHKGIARSLNGLLVVRLLDFPLLYSDEQEQGGLLFPSIQALGWIGHMKEWADENDAIPAIVLHRPGMNIDRSVLVIYADDRKKIKEIKVWHDAISRTSQLLAKKAP